MSPAAGARQTLAPGLQYLTRDQFRAAPENPKKPIEKEKLEDLKASIREDVGMLGPRPIGVADGPVHKMGGKVWGGHQRILALEQLYQEGWAPPEGSFPVNTYPCFVEDLDEKTFAERLARDNQQWADFDPTAATALLRNLQRQGTNLRHVGFDEATTARLQAQAEEAARLLANPASTSTPEPAVDGQQAPAGGAAPLPDAGSSPEAGASGGDATAPTPLAAPPPPLPVDENTDPAGTAFLDSAESAGNPDHRFPTDAQAPKIGDDLHDFVLRVTAEERSTIMRAVHDQRRRQPEQTTAQALTTICEQWLEIPDEPIDDDEGDDAPEEADLDGAAAD